MKKILFSFLILTLSFLAIFFSLRNTKKIVPVAIKQSAQTLPPPKTIDVDIFANENLPDRPIPLSTITQPVFPDLICNIVDYGAIGDGINKNTAAFEKAISACAQKGGGKVLIPAGKWLTGAIHLQSNINLQVSKGAELLFSSDFNDFLPVVFSRFEGIEYYNYSPPIYAKDCTNIAITGEGLINGNGDKSWWNMNGNQSTIDLYAMGENNVPVSERVFGKSQNGLRPSFIQFINCKNVLLEGVTLTNGPMWTIHPVYTSDMIIRNITVNTNPGKSTDGIDIDSSKNILLEDSKFNTGDDSIAIKSGRNQDGLRVNKPSENIVIRGCSINGGHAAFAIGSEISAGVKNVFIYNSNFQNVQFGLRLKGTLIRGGTIENIFAQNISMSEIQFDPIQITTNYELALNKPPFTPTTFQNIDFKNIFADDARGSISLIGLGNTNISNIDFSNLSFLSSYGPIIRNASNINFGNTNIEVKKGGAEITDGKNILFKNYSCPSKITKCITLFGPNNTNVDTSQSNVPSKKIIINKTLSKD